MFLLLIFVNFFKKIVVIFHNNKSIKGCNLEKNVFRTVNIQCLAVLKFYDHIKRVWREALPQLGKDINLHYINEDMTQTNFYERNST